MSYDVLDRLRRRLVGLRGTRRDERLPKRTTSVPSAPSTAVCTDGGDRSERNDDAHLRDLPDGAGCAEIWEHLSDRQGKESRAENDSTDLARECRADD